MIESIRTLETMTKIMEKKIESKDVLKQNDEAVTRWLSFWTVFGIFQTIEMFFGFILSFIPYYWFVRLVFFCFLMSPSINGAQILYEKVF